MASEIEKLKDDQALLLMYLADELPGAERDKINRRLGAEPALLSQLSHLRSAHATFVTAMGFLDRSTAAPVPTDAAVARASRLVRQWTTQRLARPAAPLRSKSASVAWWYYPLAAAAAVIIAVTVSVLHHQRVNNIAQTPGDSPSANAPIVAENNNQNQPPQNQEAPAPATDAASPDAAIAELPADQQEQLLNSLDSTTADENDGAVASAPAADETDNVFLGLPVEADTRGGLK
jgi:anti-sigma factor RsiW